MNDTQRLNTASGRRAVSGLETGSRPSDARRRPRPTGRLTKRSQAAVIHFFTAGAWSHSRTMSTVDVAIGVDADCVAGWLGSYGGADSPADLPEDWPPGTKAFRVCSRSSRSRMSKRRGTSPGTRSRPSATRSRRSRPPATNSAFTATPTRTRPTSRGTGRRDPRGLDRAHRGRHRVGAGRSPRQLVGVQREHAGAGRETRLPVR